ncbi:MAG: SDR family oxidoreductase, partial [Burkholderiaceae bacterium]
MTAQGYDVLINYNKSKDEAEQTATACRELGGEPILVQGDVADDAACRAMVKAALDAWGRLDVLVNNAGMTAFLGRDKWDEIDRETFGRIFDVNLVGSFQMVRAAEAALKASNGSVVNVSSIAGSLGVGSSVPYIASKGALNSLTLHLARELAPEIRVNAVCPGLITSRWFADGVGEDNYQKIKAGYEKSVPLKRASTPEDVADAVVWLAGAAPTVTGELILLDGGKHL